MANVFRVVAAGVMAAMLASAVGCSQVSEPETSGSTSDNASEQAAEVENEGTTTEAESASTGTATEYRVVENVTFPEPGADPMAMIFELRQSESEGEAIGSDQIRVSYPEPDLAVVVRTVRGLPDDSVSALRTRYVFEPVEKEGSKVWQIVQVTEQNQCRAGRGSEEWSAETCS